MLDLKSISKMDEFRMYKSEVYHQKHLKGSSSTHAWCQRILPYIIVRESLFRKTGPRLVRDDHILDEGRPSHVRIAKGFWHEPLVGFYGLEPVPHVPPSAYDQLRKIATVGHDEHIRLQAHQKIEGGQAGHMLPETAELICAGEFLLGDLEQRDGVNIQLSNWLFKFSKRRVDLLALI